jgi:DNA-binding MarR family transcriptional regulator
MPANDAPVEARVIASLLPTVVRYLFGTEDSDPVDELPLAQLRVCGILHEGSRPMSVLSRELGVSLSALTQIADRLEDAGLVNRVAVGTDRRVRRLQLTARGKRLMQHREDARIRRVRGALECLAPEARQAVRDAVELLHNACAEACAQPVVSGHGHELRSIG